MNVSRYRRQLMVEGMDEEGQDRLAATRVAIAGMGGLGSAAALYLAAAGIGHLRLIDDRFPTESDLNRIVTISESDLTQGIPKCEATASRVRALNAAVKVEAVRSHIDDDNADELMSGCAYIIDGLNDFHDRYVLNDHCIRNRTTLVHAAVEGFSGQVTVIVPGVTPCLECIIPPDQPEREESLLGVTTGVFGCIEASEVIKMVTRVGEPLKGRMLFGDLARSHWHTIPVRKMEDCPACSGIRSRP